METSLVDVIQAGDILIKSWDFRYFQDPETPHFYIKIRDGDYGADWQKDAAEFTPEFVQATLELSNKKRTEMDISKKVHLEETASRRARGTKADSSEKEGSSKLRMSCSSTSSATQNL